MDQVDIAYREEEQFRNIRILETQNHIRKELTRDTVNENTVRYCIDCGEPIPLERLKAMPGATRCVSCQTAFEKSKF